MFQSLTPIFALVIAAGIGYTYVYPTFLDIRGHQENIEKYQKNIDDAQRLQKLLEEKLKQRDGISPALVERLSVMLPERIEDVELIRDLYTLAAQKQMTLSDATVGKTEQASPARTEPGAPDGTASPGAETPPWTPVDISFSLLGTYDDLRGFLEEVERSLVFFDIVNLDFAEAEGDLSTYAVTLRTYIFNPLP